MGLQGVPPGQGEPSQHVCSNKAWQAASLKLLHERPFAAMFLDSIDNPVFDPTGLEHINGVYYVVFNRQGLSSAPKGTLAESLKLAALRAWTYVTSEHHD